MESKKNIIKQFFSLVRCDWSSSSRTNSAFNPQHCVHIKIESERWATAMVRASCGINNKQTKRTKQKMKMIFFFFWLHQVNWKTRRECDEEESPKTDRNPNEYGKQWASIWSAVSSLISRLMLGMSCYHCSWLIVVFHIHIKCMQCLYR